MRLVVFDVDGTLTDTTEIDSVCFRLALQQEFGLPEISTDWESYQYTTDRGIAIEVLTSFFDRAPTESELESFRNRFFQALRLAHKSNPKYFCEIPGGRHLLEHLKEKTEWKIAIATGGWAETALFKLRHAGLEFDFPFASCEHSILRDEIVLGAIEKAKIHYGCSNFRNVVFVGDGVWDAITAKNLGIGFIGVTKKDKQTRLKQAGAKLICRDFHHQSFLKHLNTFSSNDLHSKS